MGNMHSEDTERTRGAAASSKATSAQDGSVTTKHCGNSNSKFENQKKAKNAQRSESAFLKGTTSFTIRTSGTGYELCRAVASTRLQLFGEIQLVREPDNDYSRYAVMVCNDRGEMCGYVPYLYTQVFSVLLTDPATKYKTEITNLVNTNKDGSVRKVPTIDFTIVFTYNRRRFKLYKKHPLEEKPWCDELEQVDSAFDRE